MKYKTFFLLSLVFLYVLSSALANTKGQEETKIYVHPPSVAAEPGETFTVDIKVANVKNLYTYQFYLSWEPRLLNLTRITEGPFLNSEKTYKTSFNPRVYNTPDPFNVSGYVYVACTLLGEPATAAANGDGTLATIEFLVKEEGKTLLHLYKTKLLSHMMNEMPHVTEDGEYHFMYPTDIEINVQPLTIIDSSLLPGKDFDIDINIVKALDIYAWSLNLKWDPKLLSVSDIKEGSFLNQGYYKTNFTIHIDAEKGILYADCSLFEEPPESSASGNGTLMSITFHVKALGITVLDLYDTKIIGYGGIEVSHTTKDGYFKNLAGVEYPSAFAVSVQPSDIVNASLLPDSTFSINISIIQAVDIYAWSLKIKWDPVLLSVIDVKEGPFLNQGSYNTTFTYLDQEEGILYADCSLFEEPPESSASGNGTLMSITFHVKALGITVLDLYDTKIIGYGGIEVSHTTKDGYFKNLARDISIVSVEVSSDVVKAGDPVSVTVIVKNKGNVPENFDITVYWNDYNFGTLSVSDLNPGAEKTLTFNWDTKDVAEGNYTIKAVIDTVLRWETETADNTYINGYVTVKTSDHATLLIPEIIYAIIILVVVGGVITGFIFLRKRRS